MGEEGKNLRTESLGRGQGVFSVAFRWSTVFFTEALLSWGQGNSFVIQDSFCM